MHTRDDLLVNYHSLEIGLRHPQLGKNAVGDYLHGFNFFDFENRLTVSESEK